MRRSLLVSLALAAVLALVGVLPDAVAGLQSDPPEGRGPTLLALGDSIAFGWNALADARFPTDFVGYPDLVARELGLADVNAACPGEATGGFLSPVGVDNGCRPYRLHYLLHESYQGTQMDYALAYLESHREVRVVTIDLGVNDVFAFEHGCAAAAQPSACLETGLPAVLRNVEGNLRTIFSRIRDEAHYRGRLVVLTYYPITYQTQRLNGAIAAAAHSTGATVASGPDAFAKADRSGGGSPCRAGLLMLERPGICDIHPTLRGSELLAGVVLRAAGSPA